MSNNLPELVRVHQFDTEKVIREVMGPALLGRADKGELQELEGDEVRLDTFVQNLAVIKDIQSMREQLTTCIRTLAEYNLNMEPKLNQGREKLFESYQNRETLEAQFERNKKKIEELSGQYSMDTTMALLQTATAQAEEEAEKTVDKYLEGDMDVETFIQTFQQQKTLHHLRRVKSEKLNELLQKRTPSQNYRF
ncbi:vacuolar protein sorting-associated protein 37C [Exaiptasia diaphana]|uniref:VPS37 C-terminal domain-containing protein n=1 Tax=Exaiptasia diaphana TaxID=2652724 RepID=A0A913Y4N4_EXADI|nr:vacuolar protein sorting-associated protein 37C [Exaiptasia diaphana]KXJ28946.1 Vacuolar protein sorting-associated protein 37B [Exaiptasia diaphana]